MEAKDMHDLLQRSDRDTLVNVVKLLCDWYQEDSGETSNDVHWIVEEAIVEVAAVIVEDSGDDFVRDAFTMESVDKLLQQCDEDALVGVVENLLEEFQGLVEINYGEHVTEVVCDALLKVQVADKGQREKDQNAFAVVLGVREAAEVGGRERASTGLLVVGNDVLSSISTFLSWEKVKLHREWSPPGGNSQVESCHISPCSSMILTCSGSDLHLWDTASGLLQSTFKGHTRPVTCCRFFPDGKTFVSASCDHSLKIWDVASGSLVRTLVGHTSEVWDVAVSRNNVHILSASGDKAWKLWNSRTGELLHIEQKNNASFGCSCCSFSPNGSLLLVGCDLYLRLYSSTTYRLQRLFIGHDGIIGACSFAPDGATISSSSRDHTIKLWCITTGQCLRTLNSLFIWTHPCLFSPSGHEICGASRDGTLVIWIIATGQLEGVIDADLNSPRSICASPDGKCIVTGHRRGVVKMWHIKWGSSLG
jgi:WD40 repeat protein